MKIVYQKMAEEDIRFFRANGEQKILRKIASLIDAINENPYAGIGKPEPLKYEWSGCWSRRITSEHRLIYSVDESNDAIILYSLRGHYEKR